MKIMEEEIQYLVGHFYNVDFLPKENIIKCRHMRYRARYGIDRRSEDKLFADFIAEFCEKYSYTYLYYSDEIQISFQLRKYD